MVAFLSTFTIIMSNLCVLEYGQLIFKQSYKEDKSTKDYVSDRLSLYLLIAHLTAWIPTILFGVLADRFKVWKLLLFAHLASLASLVAFVLSVPSADHIYSEESPQSISMPISFVLSYDMTASTVALNAALMSKSIASCSLSRGVFLGAQALCSSCGILLIDGLGGHIYDYDKRNPYYICISAECLVILVIVALAVCR